MTYCARPHCNGTMVKDELGVRCMLCGRGMTLPVHICDGAPAHDVIITDPKVTLSEGVWTRTITTPWVNSEVQCAKIASIKRWEEVPMPKPQRKAPRPASFFEAHKAEIIADYRTMGDTAMCAKWGLRGHWHRWRKKWGVMSNTELADGGYSQTVVIEQTKPETDAIETLEEALDVATIEKVVDMLDNSDSILDEADATIHRLEDRVEELTAKLGKAEKERSEWKKMWAAEHERVRRLECPPILMNSKTTPVPMSHLLQLLATIAEVVERA